MLTILVGLGVTLILIRLFPGAALAVFGALLWALKWTLIIGATAVAAAFVLTAVNSSATIGYTLAKVAGVLLIGVLLSAISHLICRAIRRC